MSIEFQKWPSIPRLNRSMVITEKIDGSNAAVVVEPFEKVEELIAVTWDTPAAHVQGEDGWYYAVTAQSRKRLIHPDSDNFGFARWVWDNAEALARTLGPGRHFGEWWGSGIQRGYGLPKGEKRFSLFNVKRYGDIPFEAVGLSNVSTVPVLDESPFDIENVNAMLDILAEQGSRAAPGFMNPEGVVVYHVAANHLYKATILGDAAPKSLAAAA